jgi:hypothetical protein
VGVLPSAHVTRRADSSWTSADCVLVVVRS